MKIDFSLISVSIILLVLSGCHQKQIKSAVTPLVSSARSEVPPLELLPLAKLPHAGWPEIEIAGRKWYVDAATILTRDELSSLSLIKNDRGDVLLHVIPGEQGRNKINNSIKNKADFILMVLNGKAISLSQLKSSQNIPFYVGDESKTIQVAESISQTKIIR